ncbi:MAG: hypothetical protein HPY61_14115 [Methanotrichaceae archaeon]|nr:hypothetical protein [Methanotrichaceae archaeon]
MEIEVIPAYHIDHDKCLRCHRPLKNLRWRRLGFGKKCYAKHCQECQQTLGDPEKGEELGLPQRSIAADMALPADADQYTSGLREGSRQDRAPDPKIKKADKRAALEKAWQEEMARKDPEPTDAQRRFAEKKLLDDVDKALGLEEKGGEADPGEPAGEAGPAKKDGRKKTKASKGQVIVRAAAFNRAGRSLVVNGRDNRA